MRGTNRARAAVPGDFSNIQARRILGEAPHFSLAICKTFQHGGGVNPETYLTTLFGLSPFSCHLIRLLLTSSFGLITSSVSNAFSFDFSLKSLPLTDRQPTTPNVQFHVVKVSNVEIRETSLTPPHPLPALTTAVTS